MSWLIRALGTRTDMFHHDVWIADSTPVECGRSRETAKRSDLAGFAEYGYCASHSRYFAQRIVEEVVSGGPLRLILGSDSHAYATAKVEALRSNLADARDSAARTDYTTA